MVYTLLMQPFFKYEIQIGKKKTLSSLVAYILQDSLKRPNEVQKFTLDTCKHLAEYVELLEIHAQDNSVFINQSEKVLKLGWFIREAGERFTSVSILATAWLYCKDLDQVDTHQVIKEQGVDLERLAQITQGQTGLNQCIKDLGLDDFHKVKPLMDGKSIANLYEIKPGKLLKPLIDELISFQILHPGSSKDDAEVYLLGRKEELIAKYS